MHNNNSQRKCAVCGDTPAKVHYGTLACYGCKGFFRRAVRGGRNKYVCLFEKNCEVTKIERNSCRYCRFRKCLLVGMNPGYIRPDRVKVREKHRGLKSSLMKKRSICRTSSTHTDGNDWIPQLHGNSRRLLSDLCSVENDVQRFAVDSYQSVANFSLRSLLADRMLARKSKAPVASLLKKNLSTEFFSIQRVVATIDFIDSIVGMIDRDSLQKTTVEDKCALISSTFIPLSVFNEVARIISKGSTSHTDDFVKSLDGYQLESSMLLDFSSVCERLKSFSLSPIEYSIFRALATVAADRSKLSNTFGAQLSDLQDSLQELLFRVIKLSRSKSSASAANFMANMIAQVYEVKAISSTLLFTLRRSFPRDTIQKLPYQKILTDIINPEADDLLLTMSSCHVNVSKQELHIAAPPSSFSNSLMRSNVSIQHYNGVAGCTDCLIARHHHQFIGSHSIRPQSLSFSSKVPLTMTKSIEEMLRFPESKDDSIYMNRPLANDWADGLHLTPMFNKDVVAQFFPELSVTPAT